MTETIVVWAGDLHINSTMAICVPEFEKDDGNIHTNSKLQNALWAAWCDAWMEVKQRAKGREVVTILGGEIADEMSKHASYQFITPNTDDIRRMALETLEPMINVTHKLIVLRGTEAHTGVSSNLDEGIAREIHNGYDGIKLIKDGNRFSHYYAQKYIGGRLFDLCHHVTMGQSRRTERNAANQLSSDLQNDYIRKWSRDKKKKFELPDFALRGHVHRYSDSADNFPIHSIICPAWQLKTSFIHRIGASAQADDIGLVVIEPATKKIDWIQYVPQNKDPQYI